jgi:hypothetical protein
LAEELLPKPCRDPLCYMIDNPDVELRRVATACFEGPRGAWVAHVRRAAPRPTAHWEFVDPQGKRTASLLADADGPFVRAGFDYDGDGFVELVVDGRDGADGAIFTIRSGRPERYAAPKFVSARDLDEDARRDLFGYGRFDASVDGCRVQGAPARAPAYRLHGPMVAYHSLADGSFTDQDAVARAALAEDCKTTLGAEETATMDSPLLFGPSIGCALLQNDKAKVRTSIARFAKGATTCLAHEPFDRPATVRALTRWLDSK